VDLDCLALPVGQAARAIGVSRATLYEALSNDPEVRGGKPFLPSVKLGRRRLIRRQALAAWLAELERTAGAGRER
jgi:hypothetical protein